MLTDETFSVKYGMTLISVEGMDNFRINEIFSALAKEQVSIDIISFLPLCLSFTVSDDDLGAVMKNMGSLWDRVYCVSSNNAQITILGSDIDDTAKITDNILRILYRGNIKEKLFASSLGRITLVIPECYADTVVNSIKVR